jgi:hypothetical protein
MDNRFFAGRFGVAGCIPLHLAYCIFYRFGVVVSSWPYNFLLKKNFNVLW